MQEHAFPDHGYDRMLASTLTMLVGGLPIGTESLAELEHLPRCGLDCSYQTTFMHEQVESLPPSIEEAECHFEALFPESHCLFYHRKVHP